MHTQQAHTQKIKYTGEILKRKYWRDTKKDPIA